MHCCSKRELSLSSQECFETIISITVNVKELNIGTQGATTAYIDVGVRLGLKGSI